MIFPLIPELDLRGEEVFVIGVGGAPGIDDGRIRWVDDQAGVVPALTLHVVRRSGGQIRDSRILQFPETG